MENKCGSVFDIIPLNIRNAHFSLVLPLIWYCLKQIFWKPLVVQDALDRLKKENKTK